MPAVSGPETAQTGRHNAGCRKLRKMELPQMLQGLKFEAPESPIYR